MTESKVLAPRPVATFVLAAALVAVLVLPVAADDKEGSAVPNFKIKDLDGKNVELAELRDAGPVLLSFWATWCKPCLRELPHIDKLYEKYGEDGLQVVAVSVDQTRSVSKVKSYVKTHDFGFQVLLDPNQRVLRRLKGNSVPYTVFVSPEGHSIFSHSGYRDGDEIELAKVVDEVMAEFNNSGADAGTGDDAAPPAADSSD